MDTKPNTIISEAKNNKNRLNQDEAKKNKSFFSSERLISSASVLVVLLAWFAVSHLGLVNPLFLPTPDAVWKAFLDILQNGYKGNSLAFHVYQSMFRLFVALLLVVVTAIPLAIISGFSKCVRAAFDPLIEFYRPLPPLAYYTLLVIWLGIENPSKIALLYLSGFAPLYIAAVSGVQRVPVDRINGARSLGASGWQIFVYIIFPSCLPELFTGLRTAIGVTYSTLVAAEMVAAISGVGWMVLDASKFLRSDVIFVGIFIMGIIAVIIDSFVRWIQQSQLPWIGHDS